MDIDRLYDLFLQSPQVETDTRKLQSGSLYFALKGPHFNGNTFAAEALNRGAAYAIVDERIEPWSDRYLLVPDVLTCLQDLALHHRRQFSIPFLAITGSNGKTTTKELIHQVLSMSYITYTTQGNLNNHIGIPLSLLRVKKDAQMAVIEMGANHQQEIAGYCRYTLPTHGIITNCGKAHLEGFGGVEGVRKGKGELYDHLRQHQGTVFVMWDYDYLRKMSEGIPHRITYGTHDADITGSISQNDPFLEVNIHPSKTPGFKISSQLVGEYNLGNLLVAVAVGRHFQVPDLHIQKALEAYHPSNSRSQLMEKNGNRFVLDAYNANPSSMRAAIENFARLPFPNKILILGSMAELGSESRREHESILQLIQSHTWKQVVLVGAAFTTLPHPFLSFANADEAARWFQQQHFTHHSFLVKGSRSMQMEKVIEDVPLQKK